MAKRVAVNPKGTFIEGLKQQIEEMPTTHRWNDYKHKSIHLIDKDILLKKLENTKVPFQDRLKELEKMDKERRGMPMAIALEYQLILKFIRTLDSERRINGN